MKENLQKSQNIRHNWKLNEVQALFSLPFNDLIFKAQTIHRENFTPNEIQISTLMSIKTGGCSEDCKYCPQSAKYNTDVKAEKLVSVDEVAAQAQAALDSGASRFCMGAAWTSPKDRDMPKIIDILTRVKEMGLETCMTLGMLTKEQSEQLNEAGLDYYNHNIDSSQEFYEKIISTRGFQERLDTLEHVRNAGINVCSGGIVGMGETQDDRAKMLIILANQPDHPQSVPINMLVQVEGTPLHGVEKVAIIDFVRTIAVARIMMPESYVRLSAGREDMTDEAQALCFQAGANSLFYGEKLLTTPNPSENADIELLEKLGITIEKKKCKNKEAA